MLSSNVLQRTGLFLSLLVLLILIVAVRGLQQPRHHVALAAASTTTAETTTRRRTRPIRKPKDICLYRSSSTNNIWKPRLLLKDLKIGQELNGVIVQEFLEGTKTGPKLFLDCGVCQFRESERNFRTVNAMLRLTTRKESVARKKVTRLRKLSNFPVFCSKIGLENSRLEVVLDRDDLVTNKPTNLKSSSQLQPGMNVTGRVIRFEDYGAIILVSGYNRPGLVHISKVADAYGQFVDKKSGLKELLSRQSLSMTVLSNKSKRLELDFSAQAKAAIVASGEKTSPPESSSSSSSLPTTTVAKEPMSVLQAFEQTTATTTDDSKNDDDDYEEYYDDYYNEDNQQQDYYDEDRDIEDALGLGTY